jgi:hypothetical protein
MQLKKQESKNPRYPGYCRILDSWILTHRGHTDLPTPGSIPREHHASRNEDPSRSLPSGPQVRQLIGEEHLILEAHPALRYGPSIARISCERAKDQVAGDRILGLTRRRRSARLA